MNILRLNPKGVNLRFENLLNLLKITLNIIMLNYKILSILKFLVLNLFFIMLGFIKKIIFVYNLN